jgi:hypothetical protein
MTSFHVGIAHVRMHTLILLCSPFLPLSIDNLVRIDTSVLNARLYNVALSPSTRRIEHTYSILVYAANIFRHPHSPQPPFSGVQLYDSLFPLCIFSSWGIDGWM